MGASLPAARFRYRRVSNHSLQFSRASWTKFPLRAVRTLSWLAVAYITRAGTRHHRHAAGEHTDRHRYARLPCTGIEIREQCESSEYAMSRSLYGMGDGLPAALDTGYISYFAGSLDIAPALSLPQTNAGYRKA